MVGINWVAAIVGPACLPANAARCWPGRLSELRRHGDGVSVFRTLA
jgi:hypothetical protein